MKKTLASVTIHTEENPAPEENVVTLRPGRLLKQKHPTTGEILGYGAVAGSTVSALVNNHFHYGKFVIIMLPGGDTCSFHDEQTAIKAGWLEHTPLNKLLKLHEAP